MIICLTRRVVALGHRSANARGGGAIKVNRPTRDLVVVGGAFGAGIAVAARTGARLLGVKTVVVVVSHVGWHRRS